MFREVRGDHELGIAGSGMAPRSELFTSCTSVKISESAVMGHGLRRSGVALCPASQAGVDPTLDGRAQQDAQPAAITTRGLLKQRRREMKRTMLAMLMAMSLATTVAGPTEARRGGDESGKSSIHEAADPVGWPMERRGRNETGRDDEARVGTLGGMLGAHTHIDLAREAIVGDGGGTVGLHLQLDGGSSPAGLRDR